MRIVVVGGSAAGLTSALLLARAGHEITVLDRDDIAPVPDLETAAERAFRPGAPQIVQPHIVLARCRELLAERLPDVHAALIDAGVEQVTIAEQMPPTLGDRSTWPGDDRFTVMMTRRSTVDWVLRRIAAVELGVTVRSGVRVTGLLAEPGDPPRITGVREGEGDGADLPGPPTTRVVAALDEFTVGIWGGDNAMMTIAVCPLADDHRFRAVRDTDTFTAVLQTVPYYARWLQVLEPISDVFPMGGLHDLLDVVGAADPVTAFDDAVTRDVAPYYADQAAVDAARLAVLRHTIHGARPRRPPASRAAASPTRNCARQGRWTPSCSADSGR